MKKVLVRALIVVVGLFLLSAPCVLAQDFCEGNFDCDQDVDGSDAAVFKDDFGRSPFKNPCPNCPPPAPLPKTGQTTSYATGDDGDLEKGVVWPNPRFTDNGDGTVIDNLTGLIWLKDAHCFGTRTWNNALSDCNGLADGQCGLTDGSSAGDWRLPNRIALLSLIDAQNPSSALPSGHPFTSVQFGYWSSTTAADFTPTAWIMGITGNMWSDDKMGTWPVWPVRGGQ